MVLVDHLDVLFVDLVHLTIVIMKGLAELVEVRLHLWKSIRRMIIQLGIRINMIMCVIHAFVVPFLNSMMSIIIVSVVTHAQINDLNRRIIDKDVDIKNCTAQV